MSVTPEPKASKSPAAGAIFTIAEGAIAPNSADAPIQRPGFIFNIVIRNKYRNTIK